MPSKCPSYKKIWFPAKCYGLGWGLPVAWQGWVVLVGYLILLLAGMVWLFFKQNAIYYSLCVCYYSRFNHNLFYQG